MKLFPGQGVREIDERGRRMIPMSFGVLPVVLMIVIVRSWSVMTWRGKGFF